MTLRFKAPKFMRNMVSKFVSKSLSEELECDTHIQINEMEIGMKNKRLYSHMNVDANIDRKDFMRLIKSNIKG